VKDYYGFKAIKAKPMTRQEYNDYRGWKLPEDENGSDEGMLVEYVDSPNKNHSDHEGYISWSPLEVFSNAYKSSGEMSFGMALEALKNGCKVARKGWNGKDMFLFLVPGSTFKVNRAPLLGIYEEGTQINYRPHIDMRTVNGEIVTWVASQSDLIEEDWYILD
jgi:hypothetical protein